MLSGDRLSEPSAELSALLARIERLAPQCTADELRAASSRLAKLAEWRQGAARSTSFLQPAPSEKPPLAQGMPVSDGSVAAVSEPADAAATDRGSRWAAATHIAPSQERRAGHLSVGFGGPSVTAPAARANAEGPRWCVLEAGELFVLPSATSSAAELQLKLGLVGVRGVTRATELQAGAPHALFLDLSPEPRSREGWQGVGACTQLVLVAGSEDEALEWQKCLQRVASAYRNWRRVGEAPGAVLGGLKSVGSFATKAAGSGLGWQVGRDAGANLSRAIGLRK